jgi:hypothetical protein
MNILYFYTSKNCEEASHIKSCRQIKAALDKLGRDYLTKYIDEHNNCIELRKFVGLNNLATPTMVIVSGTGVKLAHYTPRDFKSIRRPLGETALEGELETLLDQYEIASSS